MSPLTLWGGGVCEPFVVTLSSSGAEQQLIIAEEQSVLRLEKSFFCAENSRISSLQRPFEARPSFWLQLLLYVSRRLSGLCSKAPVKGAAGLVYTVQLPEL